jgi:hypothetical protein
VQQHHGHNPNFRYTDNEGQLVGPFAIARYSIPAQSGLRSHCQFMVMDSIANTGYISSAKQDHSYTPDIGVSMMEFGDVILNQKGISVRERELAILAICGVFESPFIAYAHKKVALASGLEDYQVEVACVRRTPAGLTTEEAAVYDLSLELAQTRTMLNDTDFLKYERLLGKEKCLRVAHIAGLYIYTATFMRLTNLQAPAA